MKKIKANSDVIQGNFTNTNLTEKRITTNEEIQLCKGKIENLQSFLEKIISNLIKAVTYLHENNIMVLEEVYEIKEEDVKLFLLDPEKSLNAIHVFLPENPNYKYSEKTIEAKIPLKICNDGKEYEIIVTEPITNQDLPVLCSFKPTFKEMESLREQIAYFNYGSPKEDLFSHKSYEGFEVWRRNQNTSTQEYLNKITEMELLQQYYNIKAYNLIQQRRIEYIKNLSKEEIDEHYNRALASLTEIKERAEQELNLFRNLLQKVENYQGIIIPKDLDDARKGIKRDITWKEIDEGHKEKVKELLKNTNPEIFYKEEDEIDEISANEIISRFIGIKLHKKEIISHRALEEIIYTKFELCEIEEYSAKVRVKTSDFYKGCGLKLNKYGRYDTNQTSQLKETLLGKNSNLTKKMFFKNRKKNTVVVTSFILKIEWETNYFEVMLDDLFFVPHGDKKKKGNLGHYKRQNNDGLNRLLELMPNSDGAFRLYLYLESALRYPQQEFNLTTLLKNSGLITDYNNRQKKRAIKSLEKSLDSLRRTMALIKDWKKEAGNHDTKYILTNIHPNKANNANNVVEFASKKTATRREKG